MKLILISVLIAGTFARADGTRLSQLGAVTFSTCRKILMNQGTTEVPTIRYGSMVAEKFGDLNTSLQTAHLLSDVESSDGRHQLILDLDSIERKRVVALANLHYFNLSSAEYAHFLKETKVQGVVTLKYKAQQTPEGRDFQTVFATLLFNQVRDGSVLKINDRVFVSTKILGDTHQARRLAEFAAVPQAGARTKLTAAWPSLVQLAKTNQTFQLYLYEPSPDGTKKTPVEEFTILGSALLRRVSLVGWASEDDESPFYEMIRWTKENGNFRSLEQLAITNSGPTDFEFTYTAPKPHRHITLETYYSRLRAP